MRGLASRSRWFARRCVTAVVAATRWVGRTLWRAKSLRLLSTARPGHPKVAGLFSSARKETFAEQHHDVSLDRPDSHHAPRGHRERSARLRLLVHHRAGGPAFLHEPGSQPGAGVDRSPPERVRP